MVDFPEALCDFGSSVNIMPRLADRTLSFPKGILKNLCVRVGTLYALVLPRLVSTSRGGKTFSFKNKTTQISEQSRHEPRKRTNRRNRNKQMWTDSAKMVTAVQGGQDHRLKSPFLTKKDDLAPDGRSDISKG